MTALEHDVVLEHHLEHHPAVTELLEQLLEVEEAVAHLAAEVQPRGRAASGAELRDVLADGTAMEQRLGPLSIHLAAHLRAGRRAGLRDPALSKATDEAGFVAFAEALTAEADRAHPDPRDEPLTSLR